MRSALIIVDVQNDHCPGGAAPVPGGGTIAEFITGYLDGYALEYDSIVASKDWHPDGMDFGQEAPHCIQRTAGAEFHSNLATINVDSVFLKGQVTPALSAFNGLQALIGTTLLDYLLVWDVQRVDICGLALDTGVKATALDAQRLGFETRVMAGLCAALTNGTDTWKELSNAGILVG